MLKPLAMNDCHRDTSKKSICLKMCVFFPERWTWLERDTCVGTVLPIHTSWTICNFPSYVIDDSINRAPAEQHNTGENNNCTFIRVENRLSLSDMRSKNSRPPIDLGHTGRSRPFRTLPPRFLFSAKQRADNLDFYLNLRSSSSSWHHR